MNAAAEILIGLVLLGVIGFLVDKFHPDTGAVLLGNVEDNKLSDDDSNL